MYVFAICSSAVLFNGGTVRLVTGDVWYASDPFVKARPEFFSVDPPAPRGKRGDAPIESATSSPGQKRNTRRG